MKGLVFLGNRKLELREFPDPTPGPGEAVLEIRASGMCGSDLKFYRASGGAASLGFTKSAEPNIAGHEPCGVVVAVGAGVPANQARVGMRAMQHHYRGCGVCEQCSTGWMQLCVDGVAEVYGVTGHGAHSTGGFLDERAHEVRGNDHVDRGENGCEGNEAEALHASVHARCDEHIWEPIEHVAG